MRKGAERLVGILASGAALGALGGSASAQPRIEQTPKNPGIYTDCRTGEPRSTLVLDFKEGPLSMRLGSASVLIDPDRRTLDVQSNPDNSLITTEIADDGTEVLTVIDSSKGKPTYRMTMDPATGKWSVAPSCGEK